MPVETKTAPVWGETSWTGVEALAKRYTDVRRFTMLLCEPLEIEDYVAQSMTDASPTKWHLAHTTWFFEAMVLEPFAEGYRPFDPEFGYLFNSYYNAVGDRVARPQRGLMTRPSVREVLRYREHVDEAMASLAARGAALDREQVGARVEIGLHHEQQHQELVLTDVKHLFSFNPLRPAYRAGGAGPAASADPGPPGWNAIEEGIRWIGHDGDGFAYDNELPCHRVFLDAFEIADRLVTNREYLEFMGDGGYERPE